MATTNYVIKTSGGRRFVKEGSKHFIITFFTAVLLAAFLLPLARSVTMALQTPDQITAFGAPLWPARPYSFTYEGKDYDVYKVPTENGVQEWALVNKGREESEFIDPANPDAGLITWQGAYRTLPRAWRFSAAWSNFADVWEKIDFPRLMFNTTVLAIISTLAMLLSCVLVAYGFSRFRIPGKDFLFTVLISTIFLPGAVTLIPTYTVFVKLDWVGTWLPILVPVFFANAYDVFLLRQFFLTIPREMDEAAMIDGAGPFRTLLSVILPQSWPVIIALTVFHVVYVWNDFFGPMIYLSTHPELQPISVGLQRFNGIHYTNPSLIQAATLMTIIIPVILFFAAQRFFMQGVVITGVEK